MRRYCRAAASRREFPRFELRFCLRAFRLNAIRHLNDHVIYFLLTIVMMISPSIQYHARSSPDGVLCIGSSMCSSDRATTHARLTSASVSIGFDLSCIVRLKRINLLMRFKTMVGRIVRTLRCHIRERQWFVGARRVGLYKYVISRNPNVRYLLYFRVCKRDGLGEYSISDRATFRRSCRYSTVFDR